MMIADKLNRAGIREVEGDLIVLGHFYFNFSTSLENSAKALRDVLSSRHVERCGKRRLSALPGNARRRRYERATIRRELAPISPAFRR